ncbi:MAG: right-handed parallel beta-helix repeat-containing protein [Pyrinomonadaceae bacterium]
MRQFFDMSRAARLCGVALAALFLTLAFNADTRAQAGRSATRVWVSAATGSDTNPCTRAAPCRDLSSAVSAVADDGEVVILDSGGYDAVEITKSVQIIAPEGVHAVIAPTEGITVPGGLNGDTTAVLVNAPDATVVLRNLTVNKHQAVDSAIRATAVGTLHIEGCILNGIDNIDTGHAAIYFGASGRLMVRDTTARNNGIGIFVVAPAGGPARASIDRCRLDGNDYGVFVTSNARATVSHTVATDGGIAGFTVSSSGPAAELSCDNCVASNFASGTGFIRSGGAGAVMRVARSVATNNHYGFFNSGVGKFKSLAGTNMVDGNETNRAGQITTFSPDAP